MTRRQGLDVASHTHMQTTSGRIGELFVARTIDVAAGRDDTRVDRVSSKRGCFA